MYFIKFITLLSTVEISLSHIQHDGFNRKKSIINKKIKNKILQVNKFITYQT